MSKYFTDFLENDEYHATNAVSKSTLDMSARDLCAPMWAKDCPQDKDKIKTFDFGDAMHAICLEPERLKAEFVVLPPLNLRTTADKHVKRARRVSRVAGSHPDFRQSRNPGDLQFHSIQLLL